MYIPNYSSTLYVGKDEVLQHNGHIFEKPDLNFQFQCEFSSNIAMGSKYGYLKYGKIASLTREIFIFPILITLSQSTVVLCI